MTESTSEIYTENYDRNRLFVSHWQLSGYLLGVKRNLSHANNTICWYLLGCFRTFSTITHVYYVRVPPPPPGLNPQLIHHFLTLNKYLFS